MRFEFMNFGALTSVRLTLSEPITDKAPMTISTSCLITTKLGCSWSMRPVKSIPSKVELNPAAPFLGTPGKMETSTPNVNHSPLGSRRRAEPFARQMLHED
jgi:hypothetical protein